MLFAHERTPPSAPPHPLPRAGTETSLGVVRFDLDARSSVMRTVLRNLADGHSRVSKLLALIVRPSNIMQVPFLDLKAQHAPLRYEFLWRAFRRKV
jgi:hypothetical protein